MTNSKINVHETTEFIGEGANGFYRPEITLDSLNAEKVNKSDYIDGFCNCLSIPMKTDIEDDLTWQFAYAYLADQIGLMSADETLFSDIQLDLMIDDNEGERQYYIGTMVKNPAWDDDTNKDYSMVEINPNEEELAAIELALLKITNPEDYLRKYTRIQIAQLPQMINNQMGFMMDEINNDDLYKSVWLSQDQKTCILACIQNLYEPNSKVQMLKIGM